MNELQKNNRIIDVMTNVLRKQGYDSIYVATQSTDSIRTYRTNLNGKYLNSSLFRHMKEEIHKVPGVIDVDFMVSFRRKSCSLIVYQDIRMDIDFAQIVNDKYVESFHRSRLLGLKEHHGLTLKHIGYYSDMSTGRVSQLLNSPLPLKLEYKRRLLTGLYSCIVRKEDTK